MLLLRKRGAAFAMACVPLHIIYYLPAVTGYGYAWAESLLQRLRTER